MFASEINLVLTNLKINLKFMKKKINLVLLSVLVAVAVSCKKPADGAPGADGADGANGNDGLNGIDANDFCKTCHNVANWSAVEAQLEYSKHGDKEGNMADEGMRTACAKCHSRQGFLETLATGTDTTYSPFVGDYTLNCEVCHEFHGTLDEADFPNYALRNVPAFKSIFNKSITLDKGGSNACMSCHQNRANTSVKVGSATVNLDTITDATIVKITSQRYGGHHGPQAQLYAGVGMGEYEITGPSTYENSTGHASLTCGSCHVSSTANNTNKTGGHYYKLAVRDANNATVAGSENVTACVTCHAGTTDHDINSLQTDIKALMLAIEGKLITQGMMLNTGGPNGYGGVNTTGYIIGDNGTSNASSSNPRTVTAKKAKAIFNFKCIYEDYSYGVHNPKYIKALLTNANAAL